MENKKIEYIEHDTEELNELVKNANDRAMEMFINGDLIIIDEYKHTKEYFDKVNKEYKKRFNKLIRSSIKYYNNPYGLVQEIENIWAEGIIIRLYSPEWVHEQRIRLYNELMKPQEFKEMVGMSYEKAKEEVIKLKNKFKKT
jgi:hypothetical protein